MYCRINSIEDSSKKIGREGLVTAKNRNSSCNVNDVLSRGSSTLFFPISQSKPLREHCRVGASFYLMSNTEIQHFAPEVRKLDRCELVSSMGVPLTVLSKSAATVGIEGSATANKVLSDSIASSANCLDQIEGDMF